MMRLIEHASEWVYNDRQGPMLSLSSLSAEEREHLERYRDDYLSFMEEFAVGPSTDMERARVWLEVLNIHGVVCDHPGWYVGFRYGHRHCDVCDCYVFVRLDRPKGVTSGGPSSDGLPTDGWLQRVAVA